VVLSVSDCEPIERPQGGCVVTVTYSDEVHRAEPHEIHRAGELVANCVPGLELCFIIFDEVPAVSCDFTLHVRRGTELGPPSEPFCVPGTDPVSASS
jgi:hypothetical protein